MNKKECPEQDSNLHASRHTHLKRARLPIPPPGHFHIWPITRMPLFCSISGAENGTRTRDPNLGKVVLYQLSYFRKISFCKRHFSKCECKGNAFFGTDKLFSDFFSKKCDFIEFFDKTAPNPCDFGSLHTQNGVKPPVDHLYVADQ